MAIGLGVPRDPIRIAETDGSRRLYQPASGLDVTARMEEFTREFLDSLGTVNGFILKNRSPSCGVGDVKVYRGNEESASVHRGAGFFGGEVARRFTDLAVEDEGRLKNFTIREHFLVKLYVLCTFDSIRAEPSMRTLVDFHTRQKLLLMAYSQKSMRVLGRIVANSDRLGIDSVLDRYRPELASALSKPARFTAMVNALQHAYGGLSSHLSDEERKFFLNTLEEYRDERVPLSVPIHLLEAWALRHGNQYLLDQSLLRPFPAELADISDSGKGRDLR